MLLKYRLLHLLLGSVLLSSATQANELPIEISGFGKVVGGYLDDPNLAYQGYEDELSFDSQSLAAIQVDWQVMPKLSVTTQLLAHSNDNRESGVEWLYLTYEVDDQWQIRLGKQRTPFFRYSDVLNVGFAYHWVTPPQQLYNGVLFPTYDGLNVKYRFGTQDVQASLEGYWGEFNDAYNIANLTIQPDIKNFHGLIGNVRWQNLSAQLGFHSGDIDLVLEDLNGLADILQQAGYQASADSLSTNGNVQVLFAGIAYHDIDYFVEAEVIKLIGEPIVFPTTSSAYVSAGLYLPPFTVHTTLATSHASYPPRVNEIPLGLAPQVDQLAFAYNQVYASLGKDSLDTISVGARYDLSAHFAFKADIIRLRGKQGQRSFFDNPDNSNRPAATLYQFSLEWVF